MSDRSPSGTDDDFDRSTDALTDHSRVSRPTSDAALVRRVRWRLLAWSGGSTLVVLIVLGSLLYAAVAGSLANAAMSQLRNRADKMVTAVFDTVGPGPLGPRFTDVNGITAIEGQPGLVLGGPSSGTFAVVSTANGAPLGIPPSTNEFVDKKALYAVIETKQEALTESTIAGVPWRVLTVPVAGPTGTLLVQVLGDRTDEQRTLSVLLIVLIAGGLVALLASLGVGWIYAERALVPIRDAMRRQREFAADASHELRTPLALVRASIEHLRRHGDRPVRDVGAALDDIESGSQRLTALVDDLLTLARTDSGAVELDLKAMDLGEVALDAAGDVAPAARNAGVEIEVDAEPVPLKGDVTRLRQLSVILLDNAIRHAATAGGRRVQLAVRADGDQAVLTVDDDGPGLRQEDLARLFDRFWRAPDAPPGGTGLGLAIGRWIVERHGGTIGAANRPTGGARFEVRLPL
jgi:signal transduction histidine kinase